MNFGKLWRTITFPWSADPVGQSQYEYDLALAKWKDGREGLDQHRALAERVNRQIAAAQEHLDALEAEFETCQSASDRQTLGPQIESARQALALNAAQLEKHEAACDSDLAKIHEATRKLSPGETHR